MDERTVILKVCQALCTIVGWGFGQSSTPNAVIGGWNLHHNSRAAYDVSRRRAWVVVQQNDRKSKILVLHT